MEVILLKDIDRLGFRHDLVTVKNGYGRNFLIPQGQALIANGTNKAKLETIKMKEESERLARLDEFKQIEEQLKGKTLKIGAKTGTTEKIFGSVSNVQIAQALKEQLEIEVDRRRVTLDKEVKVLGTYTATLDLHPEVQAKVEFEVVKD